MGYEWCRLYADFATNPRVQAMNERMQRRLAMLFCAHSREDIGKIDEHELACLLRISLRELGKTKALFLLKGFIDGDWMLLRWDELQPVAPAVQLPLERRSSTSTERMRRYRQRLQERTAREQRFSGDASHVTGCDASKASHVTPGDAPEVEQELDKSGESDARSVTCDASPAVTPPVTAKVTPFPSLPTEDLQPIAIQLVLAHPYARERSWTAADVPVTYRIAAADAIVTEARDGVTRRDASLKILELVEEIARVMPRDQWRYLKRPESFFRERDYRLPPHRLFRSGEPSNGQPSQHRHVDGPRRSASAERMHNSLHNSNRAFEHVFGKRPAGDVDVDRGAVPQSGDPGEYRGDVAEGLGHDDQPMGRKPVSGCVIEGDLQPQPASILS